MVRIYSENKNGLSLPVLSINEVKMVTEPQPMALPYLDSEGSESLTLAWRPSSAEGSYNYEIHWDEDGDNNFKKLADTLQTSYLVAKVKGTRTYRFKVRARNACGMSQFSPILAVNIAFAPAQPQKVQVEQKDCTFKMTWAPPDDKGAPILRYNLEVRGASGEFYPAKICG